MRKIIVCTLAWLLLNTACDSSVASATRKLESSTFANSLAAECDSLLKEYETSQQSAWKISALTNRPCLLALRPQRVRLIELSGALVCDIQISGGFSHSGIFYTPKPILGQRLTRGSWRIEQIDKRYYVYYE